MMPGSKPRPDALDPQVEYLDTTGDELLLEERAKLHASLDRALEDSKEGRSTDAFEFLKQYRARRADSA